MDLIELRVQVRAGLVLPFNNRGQTRISVGNTHDIVLMERLRGLHVCRQRDVCLVRLLDDCVHLAAHGCLVGLGLVVDHRPDRRRWRFRKCLRCEDADNDIRFKSLSRILLKSLALD